jgi:diguanylate cyclase (GGDEF)-like protein
MRRISPVQCCGHVKSYSGGSLSRQTSGSTPHKGTMTRTAGASRDSVESTIRYVPGCSRSDWKRMGIDRSGRLESFIFDENKTAIVFYLAGAGAGAALLLDSHLTSRDRKLILLLIGWLLLGTLVRIVFRNRLSSLGTQILFSASWLLVTVATAIGPSIHVNFAVLYIWVAVDAALYFRPKLILLQTAGAEVAYFAVLVVSHSGTREIIVSWCSIFGIAVVLASLVYVLVSTLRRNGQEDRLTGLPNRRSWDERVDSELERAKRAGTELTIVSIDLDDFKLINDREGHASGDRLLRDVADRWQSEVREGGDLVARLGGDEFGLLAPGSRAVEISRVLARLRNTVPDGVACSMGVATWDHLESSADLFRRADEAMFQAKREKKANS